MRVRIYWSNQMQNAQAHNSAQQNRGEIASPYTCQGNQTQTNLAKRFRNTRKRIQVGLQKADQRIAFYKETEA